MAFCLENDAAMLLELCAESKHSCYRATAGMAVAPETYDRAGFPYQFSQQSWLEVRER
ncbi:hypothetical protein H8K21_11395 [Undibacterium oligocarboniphilum]|nr:hypothetical protein [Undibacterium oligocarboniphilum]